MKKKKKEPNDEESFDEKKKKKKRKKENWLSKFAPVPIKWYSSSWLWTDRKNWGIGYIVLFNWLTALFWTNIRKK